MRRSCGLNGTKMYVYYLIKYFHKVFRKYKSTSFLKRLLMNWTKYLSLSTYKMDDHIASALGVITHKNSYQLPEALPLGNKYCCLFKYSQTFE